MLRIEPLGAFKHGFDLIGPDGPVGGFRGSVWRESGDILVGPQQYRFRREGGRRFRLGGPQGEVAVATRRGRFSGPWLLDVGGKEYELARAGRFFGRRYVLRRNGETRGSVEAGRWGGRRGSTAELPATMPAPVQAFVVAIVITMWRRDDTSAGGGAAAASVATSG
jgi:hypothetical protein